VKKKIVDQNSAKMKEMIRKSDVLDPELVEDISSLSNLRDALFNLCSVAFRALEACDLTDRALERAVLEEMRTAYPASKDQSGRLDADAYIRKVAPRFRDWVPPLSVANDVLLFELIQVFKKLLTVYSNFSGKPILASLSKSSAT
jgi:hypothetical protein